ncbi:hypothetical protein SAMN04489798_0198 [Pseudomonas arsenicoxydans]|uniref:Inhibitor of g-type lysozyme n=1 Tax=Pseudomonas arsenicoxydans TaxID=702115 RepID=A0A1H0B2B4_9PSED|nr:hypothetical protein [Pseudomonas arsenicoxydans]SDN39780.1 hypothetical protein SAMN04489798_0198 [Pseudomonas arsenicoxydans]
MNIWITAALAALVSLPALAANEVAPRVVQVPFGQGIEAAEFKQSIRGRLTAQYRVSAKAGQILTVDLKPSNTSAYFNITAKGADYALFNGSIMGNHFMGPLPDDGEYTVQVYLMRNAARRNEVANYSLSLNLSLADASDRTRPFDQTLELQGIRFHMTTQGRDDNRVLRISPQGLEIDNSDIARPLKGNIVRAEIADLDRDGSPEIYVFARSPGRRLPGELVAYSANHKKSLSEIYLPPVGENAKAAEGYQGEDEFAVVENALVRRFPVYESADVGAGRTGKMREVRYRLVAGEAGWILREDGVMEY